MDKPHALDQALRLEHQLEVEASALVDREDVPASSRWLLGHLYKMAGSHVAALAAHGACFTGQERGEALASPVAFDSTRQRRAAPLANHLERVHALVDRASLAYTELVLVAAAREDLRLLACASCHFRDYIRALDDLHAEVSGGA